MKVATFLAVFAALVTLPLSRAVLPTQSEVNAGLNKIALNFPNWEKYSDLQNDFLNTPGGKKHVLKELRRSFDALAGDKIPDGQHLTLTFSDIHLAGVYTRLQKRVPQSLYPPRLVFSYVLTNAAGQVIKSGQADIRDDTYSVRLISVEPGDPRHFENAVLREWMVTKLLR